MFCFCFCFFCGPVCGPVGVEHRNKIPDARMTASTYYDNYQVPYYGRLNENRGHEIWCAKTEADRTDYLQVDMDAVHSVCAVATQGNSGGLFSEWTTSYKLHLSTDGTTWNSYQEDNVEKASKIIYSFLEVKVNREIISVSRTIASCLNQVSSVVVIYKNCMYNHI